MGVAEPGTIGAPPVTAQVIIVSGVTNILLEKQRFGIDNYRQRA